MDIKLPSIPCTISLAWKRLRPWNPGSAACRGLRAGAGKFGIIEKPRHGTAAHDDYNRIALVRLGLPVRKVGEMRRGIAVITILVPFLASAGCRSQQLGYDQNQFRQVLLSMYEDQLMDNLIPARTACRSCTLTTRISRGRSLTRVRRMWEAARRACARPRSRSRRRRRLGRSCRVASQAFSYGLNTSQINQLTVTANPIVDNSALYLAYVNFVERPGRLIESCDPPPPGAAHVMRQSGKKFYWVPEEYRNEFMEVASGRTACGRTPATRPPTTR